MESGWRVLRRSREIGLVTERTLDKLKQLGASFG